MSEEVLHKVQHISLYPRSISTPPPQKRAFASFFLYATLRHISRLGIASLYRIFGVIPAGKRFIRNITKRKKRGERFGCVNGGYSVVLRWFSPGHGSSHVGSKDN